jgi:hypothetical protein
VHEGKVHSPGLGFIGSHPPSACIEVLKAKLEERRSGKHVSEAYERGGKPAADFGAWRVQGNDDGAFDELVVRLGKNQSVHLEVMTARSMWMQIAGVVFWLFKEQGLWWIRHTEANDGTRLLDNGPGPTAQDLRQRKKGLADLAKRQRMSARRYKLA